MDISRKDLGLHGIYYEPAVYEAPIDGTDSANTNILPDHVDAVREALLNFVDIVPEGAYDDLLEEELERYGLMSDSPSWTQMPQEHDIVRRKKHGDERDLLELHAEWRVAFVQFRNFEELARRARDGPRGGSKQWERFWKDEVFRRFGDEARERPGYSPVFDDWSLDEDVQWHGNENEQSTKPTLLLKARPRPNPYLTYKFPVRTDSLESLKGFERDGMVRTFSTNVLYDLSLRGVSCVPTNLEKSSDTPEPAVSNSSNLSCFPWAFGEVEEHVPADSDITEKCYCRAANTAAAALELQAQLFEHPDSHTAYQQPPVIVFTCVGPNVKVWLAYLERPSMFGKPRKRMVCIWSTSAHLTWGIASLHAIILSMHVWASRILKPRIQASIAQIVAKSRSDHPNAKESATGQESGLFLFNKSRSNVSSLPPSKSQSSNPTQTQQNRCLKRGNAVPIFSRANKATHKLLSKAPASGKPTFPVEVDFKLIPLGSVALFRAGDDRKIHKLPLKAKNSFVSSRQPLHQPPESHQSADPGAKRKLSTSWNTRILVDADKPVDTVRDEDKLTDEAKEDMHRSVSEAEDISKDEVQSEEDEEGSGFDTSDVSSTDISDNEAGSDQDVLPSEGRVTVSEDEIKAWREASLEALSGPQIASLPALKQIFKHHSTKLLRHPIQRALKPRYAGNIAYDIDYRDAAPHLVDLLDLLSDKLGMNLTSEKFNIDSWTVALNSLANEETRLWDLYEDELILRPGYETAKTLLEDRAHFAIEEWKQLIQEAFEKLNDDDQKWPVMR